MKEMIISLGKFDKRKKPWNKVYKLPQYNDLGSIIMQEADLTLPEMDIAIWLKDYLEKAMVD